MSTLHTSISPSLIKNYALCIVNFALSIVLAASCAHDDSSSPEEGYGAPVTASVRLSATRSEASDGSATENINSWWVAFIDDSGIIQAIRTGSLGNAVEEDYFDITLPAGEYTVVAFANRIPEPTSDESLTTHNSQLTTPYTITIGDETLTFTEGMKSPVKMGDTRLLDFDSPEDSMTVGESLMPMSGLHKVTVKAKPNGHVIDIEVVRQTAKFEITFTNIGSREAYINRYWIEGAKSDKVYFFPTYETLGPVGTYPDLPVGWNALNVTRLGTYPETGDSVPRYTLAKDASITDKFYSLESSAANRPHKVYTLYMDVTRPADEANNLGKNHDIISALLTDIGWVNRNDHIIIPISLSDYVIKVEADFYPPIGGYPAIVTEHSFGNYTITFGSIGDFVINPHVREAKAGSPDLVAVFGEDTPVYGQMKITSITCTGDEVFDTPPYVDLKTGEIRGEIGTTTGTAYVTLSFDIPQSDGKPDLIFTRKIEIIRK